MLQLRQSWLTHSRLDKIKLKKKKRKMTLGKWIAIEGLRSGIKWEPASSSYGEYFASFCLLRRPQVWGLF